MKTILAALVVSAAMISAAPAQEAVTTSEFLACYSVEALDKPKLSADDMVGCGLFERGTTVKLIKSKVPGYQYFKIEYEVGQEGPAHFVAKAKRGLFKVY